MSKKTISRSCIRLYFLALLMIAAVATNAQAASAKGLTTVYSIGGSALVQGNMQASRDSAIANGLVMALTRELTGLLAPEKLADYFQVINEAVLSDANRFVRNYKVLTESIHGGDHRVLVLVTLSLDNLEAALKNAGVRIDEKNIPSLLVCVAEKGVADLNYRYWWGGNGDADGAAAQAITRELLKAGYKVIAPAPSGGTDGYPAELAVAEAVALARQAGAQAVVVGLAAAEETSNTMGGSIRSFRAVVDLRCYRVDSGEQIGTTRQTSVRAGSDAYITGNEALVNAAEAAGNEMAEQIAAAVVNDETAARIEVFVDGTGGNIASFVRFREALGSISGVDQLQLKEMTADTAVLSVDYQGSASSLADALLLQHFDAFGINISQAGDGTVRLRLIPRQ